VAKAATIIARGIVARVNGESAFEVAGTSEWYAVDDSAVKASTIHITGRVDMSKQTNRNCQSLCLNSSRALFARSQRGHENPSSHEGTSCKSVDNKGSDSGVRR